MEETWVQRATVMAMVPHSLPTTSYLLVLKTWSGAYAGRTQPRAPAALPALTVIGVNSLPTAPPILKNSLDS